MKNALLYSLAALAIVLAVTPTMVNRQAAATAAQFGRPVFFYYHSPITGIFRYCAPRGDCGPTYIFQDDRLVRVIPPNDHALYLPDCEGCRGR